MHILSDFRHNGFESISQERFMFIPQEFIRKKRDNHPLTPEEIDAFIAGVTDGSVTDAHIAAWAMAVFFNGMNLKEKTRLTTAMRDSGTILSWPDLDGPIVDKHSTGGVGDTVSLMLGPMLAACGAYVPMISGRGLGHTGGTLDKLESIPGYTVVPDNALFARTVRECGVAIIGQTATLAPADKRIYAVRDVTATVESIPLISASILSKKLAEGLDTLVMDVKVGSGAFMPTYAQSEALARSIVGIANAAGVKTRALLTDMNQPLASNAGNALEVIEAIDYLKGTRPNPRLHAVTMALGRTALVDAGIADDETAAERMLDHALRSGAALERFARMVHMLGGPADFVERYGDYLPKAPIIAPLYPTTSGILTAMDTVRIGMAIVGLGGGRLTPDDRIDPSVGLEAILPLGSEVTPSTPLMMIHARDEAGLAEARKRILAAITIGDEAPPSEEVYETIG
jgi:thymidine phosphorylase